MISLQRDRTQGAIKEKYLGIKKIDKEFDLLEAYRDSGGDPKFSTSWWKGAKEQLKKESHESNRRVRPTRTVKAAEKSLGLNREQLRRARWKVYSQLELFKDSLLRFERMGDPFADSIRAMIKEMMGNQAPFAGMARYFVRQEWGLAVS